MSGDLDFEPVRGLPGRLPAGETLLWQGAPDLRAMALRVFHVRKVAIYFGLLAAWRFGIVLHGGASVPAAAQSTLVLLGLGVAAVAILGAIAVLVCRTTVYSITSRRVVMRIGVALPITFNIPFKVIGSGALKVHGGGIGSIPLALTGSNRLSYLVMWPHVRPWRAARAEPMLRLVASSAAVAQILSQAVATAMPETVQQTAFAAQPAPASAGAGWPLATPRPEGAGPMHEAGTVPPFPRSALFGAAALVGLTILSAGTSRLIGAKQERPTAAVLMSRDLRFRDQADGSVTVLDASTGKTIDVLAPGSNGFIRASLRSLGKRRQFDGDFNDVFHLSALADGRLTLDDPTTGNPIELEAFGQTNEAAFARLLTAGNETR